MCRTNMCWGVENHKDFIITCMNRSNRRHWPQGREFVMRVWRLLRCSGYLSRVMQPEGSVLFAHETYPEQVAPELYPMLLCFPKYSVPSRHSDRRHIYVHSISSCILRSPHLLSQIVHFSKFYSFLRPLDSCPVQLLSSALFSRTASASVSCLGCKTMFHTHSGQVKLIVTTQC